MGSISYYVSLKNLPATIFPFADNQYEGSLQEKMIYNRMESFFLTVVALFAIGKTRCLNDKVYLIDLIGEEFPDDRLFAEFYNAAEEGSRFCVGDDVHDILNKDGSIKKSFIKAAVSQLVKLIDFGILQFSSEKRYDGFNLYTDFSSNLSNPFILHTREKSGIQEIFRASSAEFTEEYKKRVEGSEIYNSFIPHYFSEEENESLSLQLIEEADGWIRKGYV